MKRIILLSIAVLFAMGASEKASAQSLTAPVRVGDRGSSNGMSRAASSTKLQELEKIIGFDSIQKNKLKDAYLVMRTQTDSALQKVTDLEESIRLTYQAKKQFHEVLTATLSSAQILKYVKVAFAPEVEAKTAYKLDLLKEGGDYTDAQLSIAHDAIYKYLMLEKVVYFRDKI